MKSYLFIGIDISKATLDVCVLSPSDIMDIHHHSFGNDTKGFVQLIKWRKQKSEGLAPEDWRTTFRAFCSRSAGQVALIFRDSSAGTEAQLNSRS